MIMIVRSTVCVFQSGNFHTHMKGHEEGERHCKCGLCHAAFTDNEALELHMKVRTWDLRG
jgi:hypothetical protein